MGFKPVAVRVLLGMGYCLVVVGANLVAQEVVGSLAPLELIRQAQRAHLALYPSGRLEASVDLVEPIVNPKGDAIGEARTETSCRMIWKDADTYWEYERDQTDPRDGKPIHSKQRGRMVLNKQALMAYVPEVNLAQIRPRANASVPRDLQLRPEQAWFAVDSFTWLASFGGDPNRSVKHVKRWEVSAKGDDRIVVVKYVPGQVSTTVVSLSDGCNVIDYEVVPTENGAFGRKASYRWRMDSQQRPVLEESSLKEWVKGQERSVRTLLVKVTDFDPNPSIPANLFTLEGLQLAPNTKVEDEIAKRVYNYRPTPRGALDLEKELRGLSKRLAEKGFAKPRE